jgi:hypothetical protein
MKRKKLPGHIYAYVDVEVLQELSPDALKDLPSSLQCLQPFLREVTKTLSTEKFTQNEKVRTSRVLIPIQKAHFSVYYIGLSGKQSHYRMRYKYTWP